MWCPRVKHFARLNPNGTVSRCGHMTRAPQFLSFDEMTNSEWQRNFEQQWDNNVWPDECIRCKETEEVNGTSIRMHSIDFDKKQVRADYLIIGGVLDNVCNSACQMCDQFCSTKIGSLMGRTFPIIDNTSNFWKLPTERIVQLDINGGEPSASKNYRKLLQDIPSGVNSIRINTNCSTVIPEIDELLNKGIHVTVTVSLDGIDNVHDYVRWPIKWDKFYHNLMAYKGMGIQDLNTWTTVSALNVGDFKNIKKFTNEFGIDHSYAFLKTPTPLDVTYKNRLTIDADIPDEFKQIVATTSDNDDELMNFIKQQDALRNISINDYIKF